tara:strand:- start:535 stop:1164 length:630 start_codon:yes stop_codon:yes gene_type:complete
MKKNILIIDYGMGNIASVCNAISSLNCNSLISNDPKDILKADGIILPGVGAFGEAIKNLKNLKLFDPLKNYAIKEKKPLLGICLGMQLLADFSNERGSNEGLGLIPGNVRKIKTKSNLPLPHVGWNDIKIKTKKPLFKDIHDGNCFYFVHSYYFDCDKKYISSTVEYGETITASVQNKNIYGAQFHPEKSQSKGKIMLKNFIDLMASNA